jgi:acetyl esterase/lipase
MTTKPLQPPKGMWVIPVTFTTSNPKKQLIEAEVRKSIEKLGQGIDRLDVRVAEISGEWQGVKRVPNNKSKKWSREKQFAELQQDTTDAPVILYFHGGAYIVASPDTHRIMTLRLAEGCGGRVFSLRYRLAPQNPFPAALIDAILAYKYLIDPPEGALHQPVDPAKIVIAGDSAGVYSL